MSDTTRRWADALRWRRRDLGITQVQMVRKLVALLDDDTISQQRYSRYELARQVPTAAEREALALILGVPVTRLFRGHQAAKDAEQAAEADRAARAAADEEAACEPA